MKDSNNGLFNEILKRNHIICFSETWRDPKDIMQFNLDRNFVEFHELGFRNHRGGSSGGMSLLVHASVISHVAILSADSYQFWCKLDRTYFNWDLD